VIAGWDDFFMAQVGASAALAGLLFVGVSINMPKILSSPILPRRALQALVILLAILVVSSMLLVPSQSVALVGLEVLVTGAATWVIVSVLDVRTLRSPVLVGTPYRRAYQTTVLLSQAAILPYLAGGVVMLATGESWGLYLVVFAVILSFLKAISDAWVLLVEINR
jgi:hypothetical protein